MKRIPSPQTAVVKAPRAMRRSDVDDFTRGTVVVADDDPVERALLEQLLSNAGYRVIAVENGQLACEAVLRERPELVILDWSMPVMNGLAALDILKSEPATLKTPVIMLTSYASIMEQGVHAGVHDFIIKPYDPAELVARIKLQSGLRRQASKISAIALRRAARAIRARADERIGIAAELEELRKFSTRDALTGLPNRILLSDRLEQIILSSQRRSEHFATLFLDLDGFKEINDRHGHLAGDRVLRTVANRIEASIRSSDTVARFGGDEFVVIAPKILTPKNASELAERLIEAIGAPIEIEYFTVCVQMSVGLSLYPLDGTEGAALIGCADSAMYLSKRAGRNRYTFANEAVLSDARLWDDAFGPVLPAARAGPHQKAKRRLVTSSLRSKVG
jgi:diguanylate cyclase (GGDEF)-like protein